MSCDVSSLILCFLYVLDWCRDPITLLRYSLSMARCLSDILLEERLSENQRAATGLEIST